MKLVVDSNILIAGLLRDGITRGLLMEAPIEFVSPDHVFAEIRKHQSVIAKRANLSAAEFGLLLALMTERLTVVPAEDYASFLANARQRIGHLDLGDVPFLALALKLDCGIWTHNERDFEGAGVKLWKTSDVAAWTRSPSAA
jgi:predicted nucleic acid-binding protein